jgi:3',5'-cyclic AMP phosphodiesterase CpdA
LTVVELTTVADDEAVLYDGATVWRETALAPDTAYERHGVAFRTLPRPPGERLATVATVNDVHFGEVECGVIEGFDVGPVLQPEVGEAPYPLTMNGGAVDEMAAIEPDAVIAKGDLTADGAAADFEAFLDMYRDAFGSRLLYVRGNHDAYHGETFADASVQEVSLPGVILAVLDTVRPGDAGGQLRAEQLEWLDELGARADRPVLVFGHHHPWKPGSNSRPDHYFGIRPDDSERLVEVVARRPALIGYFAGHTHRNRVRRFAATGDVPWVEVACVKDYPGTWAEYRIYEGGVLQIHRRISTPAALSWSERCRAMLGGLYPQYAFGTLDDRCLPLWPRLRR